MPSTNSTYPRPPENSIKIALRLVPLMTGWNHQELVELALGEISPSARLRIHNTRGAITLSEIKAHLSGHESLDALIKAIPTDWYVLSQDLDNAHHNRLIFILAEFETEAWRHAIAWKPDLGVYETAIHECPDELLSLIQQNKTSRTADRNVEILTCAERIYIQRHAPKPNKEELCKLVVKTWNNDTLRTGKITLAVARKVIPFKELKKK